jgi:hypothetical protein
LTTVCAFLVIGGCKTNTAKDAKPRPVLVLEEGMLPRVTLRYAIQEGYVATSTMELSITSMMTKTSEGEELAKPPGLRFVVSSGPAIKLPSGNARLDIRVVEAEAIMPSGVDPDVARALNESAAMLQELGGWIEIDDRGIVKQSELNQAEKNPNLPTSLLMTLIQARTSIARVVLPEEPVGLRARWEAHKELQIYGFELHQRDRYTIIDKSADKLTLGVEITQTAPKQTLKFEEEGTEFALKSLSTTARGRVILDLSSLEGNARVEGQSAEVLTVKTGEGTEKIELDSAFQLTSDVTYEVSKASPDADGAASGGRQPQ